MHQSTKETERMESEVVFLLPSVQHSAQLKWGDLGAIKLLWVKLLIKGQKHVLIGACYRPNVGDKTTIPRLEKYLLKILTKHQNTILAGDFNFSGWTWKEDSRELKPNTQFISWLW